MIIERILIDVVTQDCGENYSALDHIYQWFDEHGNGQYIIEAGAINLKLVEEN